MVVSGDAPSKSQVDRTYKLYYAGAQKRPDANYSRVIRNVEGHVMAQVIDWLITDDSLIDVIVQVGESNRKDVRNAVDAALKAQPAWAKRSPFNRQQILYYIAENLDIRRRGFARRLTELTGMSQDQADSEVSYFIMIKWLIYLLIIIRWVPVWPDCFTGPAGLISMEELFKKHNFMVINY